MIKKIVLSLITVLSFCSLALAQNKQVTGTVTDEKGEPIIGATVVAEGTSAGTTTGGDGQFTLTVPANATLSISFIGYETQKVSVAGKTHIDVTLGEEATGIEDVVVIGYGTGKKIGSVIGSVDQVKSEKIENRPSTNVVDALQGQVAGLQIMTGNGELTSTSSIRIHGLGSMGADTSPLILLDGAPIQASTLQTINQNDIASVNVLKDASATSIYGSRAANGVIYVQTKTGRRNQESVDVTLTGQYSMSSAVAPELNMMSANEMLDYIGAAVAVRLSGDALTTPDKIASGRQYFIRNFGLAKFMDENYNPMNDYKWWNEILERNAPMYQVDLSVSGGSAKTSYYFSGNYANKTGILPGSELDRYNFRTNIDTRANNWLRLGLNLGLGYQHSSVADTNESMGSLYVSNPVMASLITPPYQPLYDDNGQMLNFFDATQAINPLMTADYMPRWQNRITMNGMAFIELTPVKGLTIRSSLAVDAFDWRSHGASSPETPTPSGKFGTGSASELFQRFYEWTWTNTAEYKHTWNEVHNFTALLGEETLYRNNNSFSVASIGITSSRFLNIAMGTEVSGGLPTMISPYIDGSKNVSQYNASTSKENVVTLESHEREWDAIFAGIQGAVDIVAFQDGHVEYDELVDFLKVNKKLADRYGLECWTNSETFDRDMPIKFLPIKWEKLRLKMGLAAQAGYRNAITFEFSHFMSPQSAYLQAGHLYDRYMEYLKTLE